MNWTEWSYQRGLPLLVIGASIGLLVYSAIVIYRER